MLTATVNGMNPENVVGIVKGIAALRAVISVAGGAAIIAAIGACGWLVVGIAAIVAVIGRLVAFYWDDLIKSLNAVIEAFKKFGS